MEAEVETWKTVTDSRNKTVTTNENGTDHDSYRQPRKSGKVSFFKLGSKPFAH